MEHPEGLGQRHEASARKSDHFIWDFQIIHKCIQFTLNRSEQTFEKARPSWDVITALVMPIRWKLPTRAFTRSRFMSLHITIPVFRIIAAEKFFFLISIDSRPIYIKYASLLTQSGIHFVAKS